MMKTSRTTHQSHRVRPRHHAVCSIQLVPCAEVAGTVTCAKTDVSSACNSHGFRPGIMRSPDEVKVMHRLEVTDHVGYQIGRPACPLPLAVTLVRRGQVCFDAIRLQGKN
ncbi:hypothetical protein BaRGS_00035572 [Batillaria attramentaria]|uniref:Uncharacterized protein n=1 Tax=Batillaria attramentaria TaxID=370345 RepID=A0ABD0JEB2_9CAEN